MRVVILATVLFVSSSLCPSLAQEAAKPTITAPQTAPSQPDQNSQQQREQRTERGRPKDDDREMGRDWRMRRGDGERMGGEDRDTGSEWARHRDRDYDRESDKDRDRYSDRDKRGATGKGGNGTVGAQRANPASTGTAAARVMGEMSQEYSRWFSVKSRRAWTT